IRDLTSFPTRRSSDLNANPMKVRQQLQDKGVVTEEWGGDTIFQDVSALTKQGIDKLLELLVLQAEIMELKANPDRRAKGNVIERSEEHTSELQSPDHL